MVTAIMNIIGPAGNNNDKNVTKTPKFCKMSLLDRNISCDIGSFFTMKSGA